MCIYTFIDFFFQEHISLQQRPCMVLINFPSRHDFHLQTVTNKTILLLFAFTHKGKSRVDYKFPPTSIRIDGTG